MSAPVWSTAFTSYAGGRKAGVGGLADLVLLDRLLRYKRQVAKRYRVLDSAQIERAMPKGHLWISPKLDGELWFLVRSGGELALCAHNGRVLHGIPLLSRLAKQLPTGGDLLVAGELMAPIAQGRSRSHHVALALGDEQHAPSLAFHPFDLIVDDGKDSLGTPYAQRLTRLQQLFGNDGTIATVVGDAASAASHYREWVAAGKHEGLVVRSEQNLTFKIKPHFTIDVVVVAYGERLVGETRQLRELSVALVRDDGTYQLLGTVGGGFSEEDRVAWLQRLGTMAAPSSFRMANSEGTLSRFVRPEVVVEVRCSDLLLSDAEDLPIRRMTLRHGADGWTPLGEQTTAVMLHPTFSRERSDKQATAVDCGMTQITSRVQMDEEPQAPTNAASNATVHKREVWTKETKGLVAVRKYVLIESNKAGRDHPPFVLFYTDFSPGRAEPLQTTLRTVDTRATADRQIGEWIEENVKKGWNPAGSGAPAPAPAPAATKSSEAIADGDKAAKKRPAKKAKDETPG